MSTPRRTSERGAVAGAEVLAVGVLVLVTMVLSLAAAWRAVDTQTALDDAAREYLRTYTEQEDAASAAGAAAAAARTVLERRGTPVRSLRLVPPAPERFGPCADAHVELRARVPRVQLPFGHEFGTVEVVATADELVDAHKEVHRGPAYDPSRTTCATP